MKGIKSSATSSADLKITPIASSTRQGMLLTYPGGR
jgi:hypothetical protein